MGDVAKLPDKGNDTYSEAELRDIACHEYVTRNDRHLMRIARLVGMPLAVVEQWRDEGNWILKRAEARKKIENEDASEIIRLLKEAGITDSREAAISTLQICVKAEGMVNTCLDKNKQHPAPEYVDKVLSAMERIEKLRKEAFSRL